MPGCTRCGGQKFLRSDEMECAEHDYTKCDACGGSGQREDQLRHYINANGERHRNAHMAETKTWVDELCQIEARKPMPPFLIIQP